MNLICLSCAIRQMAVVERQAAMQKTKPAQLLTGMKGMIEIEKLVKAQDDFSEYDGPSIANAFGHFVIPEAGFRKKTNKIVTVSTVYANFSGTPEHPMLAIKSGKLGFFRLDVSFQEVVHPV